jgi:amino acid transporter
MPGKAGSLPAQAQPGQAYTPGPGLYGLLGPLMDCNNSRSWMLLQGGIWIQKVLGWAKVILIVFMIFTASVVVAFQLNRKAAADTGDIHFAIDDLWSGSKWGWSLPSRAFFKVYYSYTGLDKVNNVLNEVKNPVKTLKSAAITALITSCILYLLVNIAYFLVVPIEDIKNSGELIAALFFERVFGAKLGRVLLPLAIATSAAGNVMVVTFSHVSVISKLLFVGVLTWNRLELCKR